MTDRAEEWRDIHGYEGLYKVSNLGRVKTTVIRHGKSCVPGEKILQQTMTTTGYYKIELTKDGKRQTCKVHRLVAEAFLENKDGLPIINHIDGNTLNNVPENLEWCTPAHNVKHAYDIGLHRRKIEDGSHIVDAYTNGKSLRQIAMDIGVSATSVRGVLKAQNIKRRTQSDYGKYGIPLDELKMLLETERSNKAIAEIYKCPPNLIARRRYQYKKGEI